MIKKSGERGAKLTRQLLTFCRKQVTSRKLLDLSGVLADMQDMLLRIIGEDVQMTTRLAPDLRATRADPAQVEQIVMNLAANARDAMTGGGKLTIETANVELDEARAAACPDLQPGPYVVLSVSDTGCGMNEATRGRLFEPFFTTKEVGKGTGLGLATVYGIVRGSGGHIEVESEVGRGSTFRIYLPAEGDIPTRNESASPPADPEPEAPAQPAWQPVAPSQRQDATILLVEDEEWVRSLTRQVLQDTGYSVLEARHGAEALRLWDTHKEEVRLIVTDVVMPEMSGFELARRVLDQRPNLKVLFISGYTDIDIASTGLLDRGAVFLPKPFGPGDLSSKLHELLCA
jgi:CheY-like chemotaxis protein